jgi:hypothetical protein
VKPEFPPQADVGYRANNALIAADEPIVIPRDATEQVRLRRCSRHGRLDRAPTGATVSVANPYHTPGGRPGQAQRVSHDKGVGYG